MKDINLDTPAECGVILLSETALFPNNSMMLNIFEPRYRQMLQHSLDTSWMFAVGDINEDKPSDNTGLEVGTIGLIRFCKKLPNGQYTIVLKGIQPVRFSNWDKNSPYPKAQIAPIKRLKIKNSDEETAIRSLITDYLPIHLKHLPEEISNALLGEILNTPELSSLIDQVSHQFIADPALRIQLLSEIDDRKRAHTLITTLTP